MRVYSDMDGVVADFTTPAAEVLGIKFIKGTVVKIEGYEWKKLQKAWPTFWMDLDYEPYALEYWRAIAPWHPSILTAVPAGWESAATGKLIWCKRMLPKWGYHPDQKFHAVMREEKQRFAKSPDGSPNVLIDDMNKNIMEWEAAGGIGIRYTPSAASVEKVVKTLKSLSLGA